MVLRFLRKPLLGIAILCSPLCSLSGCSAISSLTSSPAKESKSRPEATLSDYDSSPRGSRFGDLLLLTSSQGNDNVSASPKQPWGDFAMDTESSEEEKHPWWAQVLLWAPNRILDLLDVFKVDVGAGMSFGAVARVTKYGQVGYRSVSPLSVRVGLFGRRAPVLIEHSSEFGIGPGFIESHDRKVCKGELGLGADLFLVGGYGGVCVDELLDFVAGVFFLDVSGDDLK